jgi:DNA-binding phage protein
MPQAVNANLEITLEGVKALCRARGIRGGITGLAREIGKSREAIYFAIENPSRYRPTVRAIQKRLK